MTPKVVVTDIHCFFFFFLVTIPLQLNPVSFSKYWMFLLFQRGLHSWNIKTHADIAGLLH